MRINALSTVAERAANLALLAVAVAEYDDRTTPVYDHSAAHDAGGLDRPS